MNDNANLKIDEEENVKEEIHNENSKNGFAFLKESEIIINQIIEKIISFVITFSTRNKIEHLLPNYCFEELKQSIEILTNLDFLTHDKDDLIAKPKISLEKIKSATFRKKDNSLMLKENDSFYNSEIIRKYKFNKSHDIKVLDECSIDTNIFDDSKNGEILEKEIKKDKNILGFMIREEYQEKITSFQKQEEEKRKIIAKNNKKYNYNFDDKDKVYKEIYSNEKDPFQINSDEIDAIKNVEIHKIEFNPSQPINKKAEKINLPFNVEIDSINFWNNLCQPNAPPIDRDAGSKIKYQKPKISLNKKVSSTVPEDKIIVEEEQKNSNKKPESLSKSKLKFSLSKKYDNTKNKKKKYIQLEFESTDIDPKKLEAYTETNEICELRLKVEKELQEKKIELQRIAQKERERIAKLEEIEEKRKELSKKNVTVDIKGELVFIKPLDLAALNEEFNKGKSNTKIIKTIENDANHKNKKNLTVEKNPDMNSWDFKEDKNKKKKKRKDHFYFPKNSGGPPSSYTNKKGEQKSFDKNALKYAAGSNFRIINPEVGVSIMEDKQVKSGGKDFYKKFNRFSLEVFQDQLSKTATSNFYPTITESTDINNTINDKMRRRGSVNAIKKVKIEKEPKMMSIKESNEEKNMLSLRTKNLKAALQNLDLITEGEEKNFANNKKTINKNYIKNVMNKFGRTKTDFNEMNFFAKTLMGSNNWGGEIYGDKKKDKYYKMPKKPQENELQRELPANLLKHMPRKRLPPIINNFRTNNMGKTINGFYTNRKTKKVKWVIDDNKKGTKTERDNS